MQDRNKKLSKQLSYWLRHNPSDIGIIIDDDGWTSVEDLIKKSESKIVFDLVELKQVVETNDKKRFTLNSDFSKIKANQGHSIEVSLKLQEVKPPDILYHGTPLSAVDSIMKTGINKMNRHHVHLSPDLETAKKVGSRRGKFEVLQIEAMRMRADGYKIYISDNGVYLVDDVPVKYIKRA